MADCHYIKAIKYWLEHTVIGLNLCPFAKREFIKNRIRFIVSNAKTTQQLLQTLQTELEHLDQNPTVETSLIIHPIVLVQFTDYNDFLDDAEALLIEQGYEGQYQIASFHPDYQFAGTQVDDAENYTNRAPFPLLHLLRERSLEQAITSYPNPEQIPERNIALMNEMGTEKLQQQLQNCYKDTDA